MPYSHVCFLTKANTHQYHKQPDKLRQEHEWYRSEIPSVKQEEWTMTFKWEMHCTVLLGNRKITQGPRESTEYVARLAQASLWFHYSSILSSTEPAHKEPSFPCCAGELPWEPLPGKCGNLLANTFNICVCWDHSLNERNAFLCSRCPWHPSSSDRALHTCHVLFLSG